MKMHRFRLIHRKLDQKGFFGPLMVAHFFKIEFPTKNFLAKFFMKMHRFRFIHRKLNLEGFFGHILVARLFKIQFPIKNCLAKCLRRSMYLFLLQTLICVSAVPTFYPNFTPARDARLVHVVTTKRTHESHIQI